MNRERDPLDRLEIVHDVQTDLATICSRAGDQNWSEDEFRDLASRMRRNLQALEIDLGGTSAPRRPGLSDPGMIAGIMRASALLPTLPADLNRARTHGPFVVIDGGLASEAPETKGA